jgi:hypothetical protein
MEDLNITLKNAVNAFCHNCTGYYSDGLVDCENTRCSLYSWMPYRKLTPNLDWAMYHPRRKGKLKRSEIEVSEAHVEAGKRLAECRKNKQGDQND